MADKIFKNYFFILISLLALSAFPIPAFAGGWADDLGMPPEPKLEMLNISSVIVEIDNKKDTITENKEDIGINAKESSDVELKVEMINLFKDKKINSIEIDAIIEDIDDGDDLKETSSSFSLDAGEIGDETVRFELPLKVDDGNYDVSIYAEGKDEDGNKQEARWETSLTVKKDKHKVKITTADIEPSIVSCSGISNLKLGAINLGREDEEVDIEIKNDALGININKEGIQLNEGIDGSEYEDEFALNIPDGIAEGNYPIRIDVSYGSGRYTAAKEAMISVQDCVISKEAKTEQKVLSKKKEKASAASTKTAAAKSAIQTAPQPAKPEFKNSKSYMALLVFSVFIVTIGIVILLGVLVRSLKR